MQRQLDIELPKVVFGGTKQAYRTGRGDSFRCRVTGAQRRQVATAGEPRAGGRVRVRHDFGRRAVADDAAAMLAGPGPKIHDAIGLDHDLRVVLDHQQRIARIAQAFHDADHAPHITRVQADRRFIEHEQRIDQ